MYLPLYFLITTFCFFCSNVQAEESLVPKDYTTEYILNETGVFQKDQIVYYTKRGKWVDVTNSSYPDGKICILKFDAPLKIVDFSKEQQIVMVEILSPSSNFLCNSGDQFPVNKTSIRK